MADIDLSNKANVTGTYGAGTVTLESNTATTKIINNLTIQKDVDKQKWATGTLTYTITITNNAESTLETPIFTDVLNPDLVKLVENSVEVNGLAVNYNYEQTSGMLTINLENLIVGGTSVITFRVQKK